MSAEVTETVEVLCMELKRTLAVAKGETKGVPLHWCVELKQHFYEEGTVLHVPNLTVWSVTVLSSYSQQAVWARNDGALDKSGKGQHATTAVLALLQAIAKVKEQLKAEAAELAVRHMEEAVAMREKLLVLCPENATASYTAYE